MMERLSKRQRWVTREGTVPSNPREAKAEATPVQEHQQSTPTPLLPGRSESPRAAQEELQQQNYPSCPQRQSCAAMFYQNNHPPRTQRTCTDPARVPHHRGDALAMKLLETLHGRLGMQTSTLNKGRNSACAWKATPPVPLSAIKTSAAAVTVFLGVLPLSWHPRYHPVARRSLWTSRHFV